MFFDSAYSALANRNKFFTEGWGRRDVIEHLLKQGPLQLIKQLRARKPEQLDISWSMPHSKRHCHVQDAIFPSPFKFFWKHGRQPFLEKLPPEVSLASVQFVWPRQNRKQLKPVVIHFPATGDEYFTRRRKLLAEPLARAGIASAILTNPYYSHRRPAGQRTTQSRTVTEFLQMSRASQDEAIALAIHLKEMGMGPIGFTGISMGGYMSLAVAAQVGFPVAVAACLPGHSASSVYTEGVLSNFCDWDALAFNLPAFFKATDRKQGARQLLRQLLDLSDLRHQPVQDFSDRAILVGARLDKYIPGASTEIAHSHWPGSELRWLKADHIGTFIFNQSDMRQAIIDSVDRIADFPGSALPRPRFA